MTTTTKSQTRLDYAHGDLDHMVDAGLEAQAKFIAKVSDAAATGFTAIADAVKWSEEALIAEAQAKYAQRTLNAVSPTTPMLSVLRTMVDALTEQLVTGSIHTHSTSPLSNGQSDADATAASRFVQRFRSVLEAIDASAD